MQSLEALLDIDLPVIQAPMAGSQGSAMAIAVAQAGGLGSLPGAMLTPAGIHDELTAIAAQTSRPINVNFFCHTPPVVDMAREAVWRKALAPYYRELGVDPDAIPAAPLRAPFNHDICDVLSQFKAAVVSFHFGLPSAELLKRVRVWKPVILSTATTVAEALWLESQGVDVIIAQGLEAGGHRGIFLSSDLTAQMSTLALVPQIVSAVKVPVVAAGGIADPRGVKAALVLGAVGVQVGTTYLLCPEATTSAVHRAALSTDRAKHTALTNLYTGRPARGIVNRLMAELGPISLLTPSFPLAATAVLPLRAQAEKSGSGDFSPLWAGQNATGCRAVSAAVITRDLTAGL